MSGRNTTLAEERRKTDRMAWWGVQKYGGEQESSREVAHFCSNFVQVAPMLTKLVSAHLGARSVWLPPFGRHSAPHCVHLVAGVCLHMGELHMVTPKLGVVHSAAQLGGNVSGGHPTAHSDPARRAPSTESLAPALV